MAMTVSSRAVEVADDQCVALRDIDWKGYLTMLKLRGERRLPRMTYLDGTLWLMTTSFPHESLAERLGLFVMVVVEEFDIPCTPSGSTTFRRKKNRGGVEPDKSFYITHEKNIRGKKDLDLGHDPPPDLVIEVVYTHDADDAVEVYRRFRVPEVWVCNGPEFQILVLEERRRYADSETSAAFPFLKAAEVLEWVGRPRTSSETEWVKELRRWVRDTLAPRARGAGGGA